MRSTTTRFLRVVRRLSLPALALVSGLGLVAHGAAPLPLASPTHQAQACAPGAGALHCAVWSAHGEISGLPSFGAQLATEVGSSRGEYDQHRVSAEADASRPQPRGAHHTPALARSVRADLLRARRTTAPPRAPPFLA